MSRTIVTFATALLIASAGGCSTTTRTPDASSPREVRSSNYLGEAEIREAHASDAYDLIQRLRPNWLRTRGRTTPRDPMVIPVYRNMTPIGSPEALRRMSTLDLISVEFVNPIQARSRFGTGHTHGAILVTSR